MKKTAVREEAGEVEEDMVAVAPSVQGPSSVFFGEPVSSWNRTDGESAVLQSQRGISSVGA